MRPGGLTFEHAQATHQALTFSGNARRTVYDLGEKIAAVRRRTLSWFVAQSKA